MRRKDYTVETEFHPTLTALLFELNDTYRKWGTELVITSGSEQQARHGYASLHYAKPACAVDIRTNLSGSMPISTVQYTIVVAAAAKFCEQHLIPNDWMEVHLESSHMHIEYQPKRMKEFN